MLSRSKAREREREREERKRGERERKDLVVTKGRSLPSFPSTMCC
jgi:hypothetical protein